jgi:hypothetical protein
MNNLFSTVWNAILLAVHNLLNLPKFLLWLITIALFAVGLTLVAPLFISINYSYPTPVCGVYWNYPSYARITGSNKLILRAKDEGMDFVVKEGNYLVTLGERKELDSDGDEKKISIEFEVSPSSLWKFPPEKGLIKLETSNPPCKANLAIPLDWWTVIFRFIGAGFSVVSASALFKYMVEK